MQNTIQKFLVAGLITCMPAIAEQQNPKLSLYYAVRDNKVAEVKELLARGTDGGELLISMADHGNIPACKLLLECGVNVNAQDWLGRTALMFVVQHKATPEHMSKICLRGGGVRTELVPADNRHVEVCKLLIAAGADVRIKDFYDRTALHYALEYENEEVCELLLAHGATPVTGKIIPWKYLGVPTSTNHPDLVKYWENNRPTR